MINDFQMLSIDVFEDRDRLKMHVWRCNGTSAGGKNRISGLLSIPIKTKKKNKPIILGTALRLKKGGKK